METKREIRKQIRKIRSQIEPEEWQAKTDAIRERVVSNDLFREATDILCYINMENEVGTRQIIEEAWRLGKNVWVPKTLADGSMEFYCIHSFSELDSGAFGVMEPDGKGECAELDYGLMIVPGVAFDLDGNRIGYGKGFYDRYISRYPHLDTMGLAFDIQLLEQLPAEECDRSLDMVITETLTIAGGKEKQLR